MPRSCQAAAPAATKLAAAPALSPRFRRHRASAATTVPFASIVIAVAVIVTVSMFLVD
jgi:hypothetical protein